MEDAAVMMGIRSGLKNSSCQLAHGEYLLVRVTNLFKILAQFVLSHWLRSNNLCMEKSFRPMGFLACSCTWMDLD